jgi:hypothetical protein
VKMDQTSSLSAFPATSLELCLMFALPKAVVFAADFVIDAKPFEAAAGAFVDASTEVVVVPLG